MAEPAGSVTGTMERWVGLLSSVVAPVTIVTGLLFYFGYVSSRAQYLYFGVDVDTIGLSTQDYVMRSPQALLVPLLVITLGAAALLLLHRRLRRSTPSGAAVRVGLALAVTVLVVGLTLLLGYPLVAAWPPYAVVTPLLIAAGTAGVVYQLRMPGAPRRDHAAEEDRAPWVGSAVTALAVVVVATCLFWATATVAQWSGEGLARRTARHLGQLPAVILDTTERLYLTDPVVEETALPAEEGESYRYRYRGLRLLIQGPDAMYLVPQTWTPSNSTLRVPFDDTVRVRFQFVNTAP